MLKKHKKAAWSPGEGREARFQFMLFIYKNLTILLRPPVLPSLW